MNDTKSVGTEPDGGRKWLMAYAPFGAKGIYIYIQKAYGVLKILDQFLTRKLCPQIQTLTLP